MGRVLVLVLVCVCAVLTTASDSVGNPWHTHASVHMNVQQDTSVNPDVPVDVAATDGLTDNAVVTNKFGSTPVNVENLKTFIKQRGVSDLGLIPDLISRSACIIRVETDMGVIVSVDSLSDYLSTRQQSVMGTRDELLSRACDYQEKELAVRSHMQTPVKDISVPDLQAQLTSLGFVTTAGSAPELVYRLGKAYLDLTTIRSLTGDDSFDTTDVKPMLASRGLSDEGVTGTLLDRLAGYLVDMSADGGMVGISGHCDMVLGNSLCVDGGGKVIAPAAVPRGMVGHWTFDDAHGLDSSGLGHHAKQAVPAGPGVRGVGSSVALDGSLMVEIPHSPHFDSQDFCLSLWLYLTGDSTGQWRSLVHKGAQDHQRTPTLFLEPQTRGVEFFVSTSDESQPAGERLWSNTFVPLRKWTHIAACAEGRNLRLFVNGILDAENTTIGTPLLNEGSMYIGNDPWRPSGGVTGYVDEVKYHTRALTTDEIQAQAHPSLGGVEPVFVELGCMGCTVDNCPKACRRGYRMCTTRDLHSGAYMVARSMGWANADTRVWSAEDDFAAGNAPSSSGLCMCCREED